jgi:hypothetical protein
MVGPPKGAILAASKLPANQIIGEAFGHVFANLRPLARAAAVPFAVMTAVQLRALWAREEGDIATYAVVVWIAIQLAATVPFQTQTYRFILAITPDSTPRVGWPWGLRETMFVLNAAGLAVIGTVAVAFLAFVAMLISASPSGQDTVANTVLYFGLFMVPAMLVAVYATARIGLVFAAAAVGRPTTWRLIWRASMGNGWRIVWLMVVTILPWSFVNLFIQQMMMTGTNIPLLLVLGLAANIVGLLGMAVPSTALGLAYRHLVLAAAGPPRVSLLA